MYQNGFYDGYVYHKKNIKYRITNSSQRFGFVKFEQSLIESKINTNISIDMCNAMFFLNGVSKISNYQIPGISYHLKQD